MKWIKVAIGAVIAVMSIGIVATSVYKITQPSEVIREVSFEIDYNEGTYSPISIYNDIEKYSVIDDYLVLNVSIYVDDEITTDADVYIESDRIIFSGGLPDLSGDIDFSITDDGSWYNEGYSLTYNSTIKLIFNVIQPPQITGISATLILLIPLLLIGSALYYFYQRKEEFD